RNVFPVMAPALALAADPGAALVRLERVGEAVGARKGPADALATDPGAARRLAHVVGASRFATDLLVADPERLRALADDAVYADDADAALVRVVARYAARELTPRATGDAITEVADRVLADAVDRAAATARSGGGSSRPRPMSRTRRTASRSTERSRCAGCASGSNANA